MFIIGSLVWLWIDRSGQVEELTGHMCDWLCQMCTCPPWQIFSHGHITWSCLFVSGLTTLLNSLKISCFLLQLASIWGQLCRQGCFRHGYHFFVLVWGNAFRSLCCVTAVCGAVGGFSRLSHSPDGHMQHMEFILLHALFTLIQHQLRLPCKCWCLIITFGIADSQLHRDLRVLFMSDYRRHDLIKQSYSSAQRPSINFMTEGSTTSDVTESASVIRTPCTERTNLQL